MLPIKALRKVSAIDYPGRLATTVFVGGCNFRCPYCYNAELVLNPDGIPNIPEQEVLALLSERVGFIDGVCMGGGEPTIHPELPGFLEKVKEMGLLVKLDTNGSRPDVVEKLIERGLVDYVAMDFKTSPENYSRAVGVEAPMDAIMRCVEVLRSSEIEYEFRTTVVPGIVGKDDLRRIGEVLGGSRLYVIQQFRPWRTLDPNMSSVTPYTEEELKEFAEAVKPFFERVVVRI